MQILFFVELLTKIAGTLKNKTSFGPDNISSKLLTIILPQFFYPLCHLFNLSFQTGYIPIQLKMAKVVPIFKSGDELIETEKQITMDEIESCMKKTTTLHQGVRVLREYSIKCFGLPLKPLKLLMLFLSVISFCHPCVSELLR